MLNKENQRELAYIVKIDAINPIIGSDNCESATVNGWNVMVRKNTFKVGDPAIYFEIDSHVDTSKPEFAFLEKRHGNVKTQKYTFGGKGCMISQGLLMSPQDFGWTVNESTIVDGDNVYSIGTFLTKRLNVTYAEAGDNTRKASYDKYKAMQARHRKLFSNPVFSWMMEREWGKKALYTVFGERKKKHDWPDWVVKTDEERIENVPWFLKDKASMIATEKIDGTSTTFTMKRKLFGYDFYVCSRNVVFDKPDKQCFYDTNVYLEMANKYNIENTLKEILLERPDLKWVTIQGETYGEGIQKRDYHTSHDFAAFNFITSREGRWNSTRASYFLKRFGIPWVPIINEFYVLPDSIDELRAFSHSKGSSLDGEIKEGIVFRSQDGKRSFKCVDPEYLIKYHS